MIEVSDLTKIFGHRTAIDHLNFKIKEGEIVGFLGPNGAGKSTTMKILTGVIPATSGTARVAGFDIFDDARDVKKNIGYLPENPPVYFDMYVDEYLKFVAKLHFVTHSNLKKSIDLALEKTGLTEVRNRVIGNLSKGYRQRVGLAQALVHDPKVLILDEPTVGLDPVQIIEVRELIKSLAGAHTVVLSTHILPEVTATCERIILINKGRLVSEESIEKRIVFQMLVRSVNESGLKALKSISGVKSIHNGIGSESGNISIEINPNQGELRDQLLEVAMQEKMGVLEFSSVKLNLEDIFLSLSTSDHHGLEKRV